MDCIFLYKDGEKIGVYEKMCVRKRAYYGIKRAFDVVFSLVGMLLFALPMLLIALHVMADSKGPVFFLQERLGKSGKKFKIIKFRTMPFSMGGMEEKANESGNETKIGYRLRKSHLDELPQLFNILKGEMSFVGPRPEREYYYRIFDSTVEGFRERLSVVPGLTGWAQVNAGHDVKPEVKLRYDMEYIQKQSLWFDFKCLVRTIFKLR